MLATKIIIGIYSSIINSIKHAYSFLSNAPALYKENLSKIKDYIEDFKYKIKNLREANFELGLYHLSKLNLNDAIIRFKLIDKFLNKNDSQANYRLGWCYFLKRNFNSSLYHLRKSGEADATELKSFIEDYSGYSEIPEKIFEQFRDFSLASKSYFDRFEHEQAYLPTMFIQKVLEKISDLPDEYNILEINCGVGLAGIEAKKRLPDHFKLTGIEVSEKMLSVADLTGDIYDELLNTSLKKFVSTPITYKFDIIMSLCGLIAAKDFRSYLNDINLVLNNNGYLACCLPAPVKNQDLLKTMEYRYNLDEVEEACKSNDFILLGQDELELGINNKYYIYIYIEKSINNL